MEALPPIMEALPPVLALATELGAAIDAIPALLGLGLLVAALRLAAAVPAHAYDGRPARSLWARRWADVANRHVAIARLAVRAPRDRGLVLRSGPAALRATNAPPGAPPRSRSRGALASAVPGASAPSRPARV